MLPQLVHLQGESRHCEHWGSWFQHARTFWQHLIIQVPSICNPVNFVKYPPFWQLGSSPAFHHLKFGFVHVVFVWTCWFTQLNTKRDLNELVSWLENWISRDEVPSFYPGCWDSPVTFPVKSSFLLRSTPFFDHEFAEEIAEIKQQIQKTEDATREKVRISMEFFFCEVITIMKDFRIILNLFMDDTYIYTVYYIHSIFIII